MSWKLELHSWDANLTRLGEITNARQRQLTAGLNRVGSLSFTIDYDNPLAETILGDDGLVVVAYKQNRAGAWVPVHAGPIEAIDESAGGSEVPTIAVASAGAAIRLSRLIADDGSGLGYTVNGLKPEGVDKAAYMRQLITWANQRGANSWLRLDSAVTAQSGVTIDSTEGVGGFQTISGLLEQFVSAGDVEWLAIPAVSSDSSGAVLGYFQASGLLGQDMTSSLRLEFGVGQRNIATVQVKSENQMANTVYHVRTGATPYSIDPAVNVQHRIRYGLLEEVADADLEDAGLRKQWVDSVGAVRSKPRRFYELTLMPETEQSVPRFFEDYKPGDRVAFRAKWEGQNAGREVETTLRIYDVTVSLSEDGTEQVQLGLTPSG